jgi:hypothetical protein
MVRKKTKRVAMEGKESKKIMCRKIKIFKKKCDQESHQIGITILVFFLELLILEGYTKHFPYTNFELLVTRI